MSTFSVTPQQTQIYLGEQPAVTLYNAGPVTVYLDTNPSVTPESGFPLQPTGQMTWKSDQQLWAVTGAGTARLYTNPSGGISDNNRASFDIELYSASGQTGATLTTPTFECGFANTLLITRTIPYGQGPTSISATVEDLTITWYDDTLHELQVDFLSQIIWHSWDTDIYGNQIDTSAIVQIPVRGRYCVVSMNNLDSENVRIVGSDRVLPMRQWNTQLDRINNTLVALAKSRPGYMKVDAYDVSDATWLPNWGTSLQIAFRGTVTTAGFLLVMDAANNTEVGYLQLPASASLRAVTTIKVPTSIALRLGTASTVVSGSPNIALVWEDYNDV